MPKRLKPTIAEAIEVANNIQQGGARKLPSVKNNPEDKKTRSLRRSQTKEDLEYYAYNKHESCLFTASVLYDMRTYFMLGGTDGEACRYAGVLPNAYYVWRKKMPKEIRESWDELVSKWKDENITRARFLISQQIGSDVNLSKWYLERKRKEEFAPQVQAEIKNVEQFSSVDDNTLEKMLKAVIDKKDEQGDN